MFYLLLYNNCVHNFFGVVGEGSYPYTVCAEVSSRHRAHHTDLIVPTCLIPRTGQILIARWTNYARSRSYKIAMFTSIASVCTSVS